MLLSMSNLGCIKTGQLKLKGITVLFGEQNSGKSTVAKALYAIQNTLHKLHSKIEEDRLTSIKNICHETVILHNRIFNQTTIGKWLEDTDNLINTIMMQGGGVEAVSQLLDPHLHNAIDAGLLSQKGVERILQRVEKISEIPNIKIAEEKFLREITIELGQPLYNIEESDQPITLQISTAQGETIFDCLIRPRVEDTLENTPLRTACTLHNDVVYLDNPNVLNRVNDYDNEQYNSPSHHSKIIKLLRSSNQAPIVDCILRQTTLKPIVEILSNMAEGQLIMQQGQMVYTVGRGVTFSLQNLSNETKIFLMIKTLLQQSMVVEGDVLILDGIDKYLSTKGKRAIANIIAMLCAEYTNQIVVTTSDPDFRIAINNSALKYNVVAHVSHYVCATRPSKVLQNAYTTTIRPY